MPNTLDAIELPDGIEWADRLSYLPVIGTERTTLGGVTWQWSGPRYNRPITLAGGPDTGWMSRADYEALRALAADGGDLTLTWAGTTYPVRFRYAQAPVLTAVEVRPVPTDPLATDWLAEIEIKLITIAGA